MTDKEKLRKEFFEKHTIKKEGLKVVSTSPHNLFEWFWLEYCKSYDEGHKDGLDEGYEQGEQL